MLRYMRGRHDVEVTFIARRAPARSEAGARSGAMCRGEAACGADASGVLRLPPLLIRYVVAFATTPRLLRRYRFTFHAAGMPR